MRTFDFEQIKEYLDSVSAHSKLYIGCDSVAYKRHGKWYADFYKVIVVHIDGCHGCKIFGEIETEMDYSANRKKPTHRLMSEVYKVAELYGKLAEITDRGIEVHLDLNPNKKHVSNLITDQAIGYIRGSCNVIPLIKPDAFAASYAADRLVRGKAV
jgi:predicted RNase H-related nuclease YkuK (DUF458 family)